MKAEKTVHINSIFFWFPAHFRKLHVSEKYLSPELFKILELSIFSRIFWRSY